MDERARAAALIEEITHGEKVKIISEELARLAGQTEDGRVHEEAVLDAVCERLYREHPYVFDLPRGS